MSKKNGFINPLVAVIFPLLFLLIIVSAPSAINFLQQKQYHDKETGLSWQRCSSDWIQCPEPLLLDWSQALRYCHQLHWDQQQDWRLPNRHELISLINVNQRTPSTVKLLQAETRNNVYWSSSTDAEHPEKAYYSSFFSGYSYANYKIVQGHVRCVRNTD
jgi:hypothetical protein